MKNGYLLLIVLGAVLLLKKHEIRLGQNPSKMQPFVETPFLRRVY